MAIKNNTGITRHLQRIFFYGDELMEEQKVSAFVEYLRNRIDPATDETHEISARSLYAFISGERQFPHDLGRPLADWSADEEFMMFYGYESSGEAAIKQQKRKAEKLNEIRMQKAELELKERELEESLNQLNFMGRE